MTNFIPVMTKYIGNDVVLNTLVQMELGHVYESSCQECEECAQILGGSVPDSTPEQRAHFAGLVSSRPPEPIETLLARASSLARVNTYASGSEQLVKYAINQVFSIIGWNLQLAILAKFLRRQFEDAAGDHVFISFNYDLVLDRSIAHASEGRWQPTDGYGFTLPYYTTEDTSSSSPSGSAGAFSTQELPFGSPRIRILKPHGSLNWLLRRSNAADGQSRAGDPERMVLVLDNDCGLRYWPSTHTFNYISGADTWPRDFAIHIVAPTPDKPPIMQQVLSNEEEALKKAEEMFVIGYSLPKTDRDQQSLIKKVVSQRERRSAIKRLTVVNYGEQPSYFEMLSDLFKATSIRKFNDGFEAFVAQT
jgi:hypothetical protein